MAQHDYVIANGTGAAVRSDINNGLAAIVSQNSGTTEPATMYAYQWWADETTGLLKIRNAANNAWITVGTLASTNLGLLASGGTLVSALGSASTPGITFTGDLNTGIYSPGADQVSIATGGSDRVSVDASGNVTINAQGDLRFADSDSSNWVAFQAPGTVATNITWTLPDADGTSGQALTTNGSGTLSWSSAAAAKISVGNTEAEVVDTGVDGHFKVTTEGTEALRVDASQRLLVGTSTAVGGGLLQIRQDSGAGQVEIYRSTADSGGTFISLSKSRGTAGSPAVVQDGDIIGTLFFQGYSGAAAAYVGSASIAAQIDGTPDSGGDTTDMPGRLVFSTAADGASTPTERMRIGQNGLITCTSNNTSGGSFAVLFQNSANTELFKIENNGTWFTGNAAQSPYNATTALAANLFVDVNKNLYRSTSSERYKKNIETLEDCYADNILNCRPVWYQSTCSGDNPDWGFWGFIAEEVEKIDPRLCFYGKDEEGNPRVESVQYDRFVPHLLNLVKRQQQAIETLEAKVAALEGV
jgi:hypothetical protein